MRRNLSDRVAALEESSKGEFMEVRPLAYFYGDPDAKVELIPMKEWKRKMALGVGAFYGDDDDSEARQ